MRINFFIIPVKHFKMFILYSNIKNYIVLSHYFKLVKNIFFRFFTKHILLIFYNYIIVSLIQKSNYKIKIIYLISL